MICTGEFGFIEEEADDQDGGKPRFLSMDTGWVSDEGRDSHGKEWRLSTHAAARVRAGKSQRLRRAYGGTDVDALLGLSRPIMARVPAIPHEGIVAICPVCKTRQILDPDRLGIEAVWAD